RLPVREQQDREDTEKRERDRDDEGKRRERDSGDEDPQDLLGRVRRGGEVVAREHRERGRLAQPLVDETRRLQRLADDGALDRAGQSRLEVLSPALAGERGRHVPTLDALAQTVAGLNALLAGGRCLLTRPWRGRSLGAVRHT